MNLFTRKEIFMMRQYVEKKRVEILKESQGTDRLEDEVLNKRIESLNNACRIISKNNYYK